MKKYNICKVPLRQYLFNFFYDSTYVYSILLLKAILVNHFYQSNKRRFSVSRFFSVRAETFYLKFQIVNSFVQVACARFFALFTDGLFDNLLNFFVADDKELLFAFSADFFLVVAT